MFNRLIKRLQPPPLENQALDIQAQNTFVILLAAFALTLLFLGYTFASPLRWQIGVAVVVLALEVGIWLLLRARQGILAGAILNSVLWIAILVEVILYGGVRDSGFAAFIIIVGIASLTLGTRGGVIFTVLTILAGIGMVIAEESGSMPPRVEVSAPSVLLSYGITTIAVAALLHLAVRTITSAAEKAAASEREQRELNRQLGENRARLEEKTRALEKRALALQAIADLARLTGQSRDEAALLESIARLIPERLDVAHAGIYLTDAAGEYALLAASNSQAGQALLADRYQLKITHGELIFIAPGTEQLRYRVGGQTHRLPIPMLVTGARFSHSCPLIADERLLGLLNVQSGEPIREEEANTLQAFADQLGLSIHNIRLLAQLQEKLRQIGTLAGQSVRKAWETVHQGGTIGYQYDRLRMLPSSDGLPPEATRDLKEGKSTVYLTTGQDARTRLVAPLILRDEIIGVLGYEDNDPTRIWRPDEKTLLETIASQVSLAMENSRLVNEAQQRAQREQVVSEIIGRIAAAVDMDTILKSTVEELGQLVGESEIAVQLVAGENK